MSGHETYVYFYPNKRGDKLYGAFHEHKCPMKGCGKMTTGTGDTLCPSCASVNFVRYLDSKPHKSTSPRHENKTAPNLRATNVN